MLRGRGDGRQGGDNDGLEGHGRGGCETVRSGKYFEQVKGVGTEYIERR